jgi:hypothetical protein
VPSQGRPAPPKAVHQQFSGPRGPERELGPGTGRRPYPSPRKPSGRSTAVNAGDDARSIAFMNDDINPGTCAPTGVDRNNTIAINANTTAPPDTRAFAQM